MILSRHRPGGTAALPVVSLFFTKSTVPSRRCMRRCKARRQAVRPFMLCAVNFGVGLYNRVDEPCKGVECV